MPKVSVIVPVYNTEKYLKRCTDSLLNQTLQDLEIILVDDGSKEPCALLCDEIAKTDARIKVIHKTNAGAGYARNTGLEAATGEYIGFVDSDDYVQPQMYEKFYNAATKYDGDMILSGVCFVGGNTFSKVDGYLPKNYFEEDTVFEGEQIKTLLLGVVGALPHEPDDSRYGVGVWKSLFRNALIQEKQLQFMSEREVLSEDLLFIVDFVKQTSRAIGIPGTDYCYCRNEDSFSKSYNPARFGKTFILLNELEKRLNGFAPEAEYRIYLDRLAQGYGRILCSQEIVHAKEEKIKHAELKNRLREICANEKMKGVLKTYPWYKLPIKQAAFAFTMKYRLYLLQKIMVLLRDR